MSPKAALLASLALAGCGGGQSAVPPPTPRPGGAVPTGSGGTVAPAARLQFRQRAALRYEIFRYDSLQFLSTPDNPPQVTGRYALVTVRADGGRVVVALDSVSATQGARLARSTVDSAKGVRWEVRLTGTGPSGELKHNRTSILLGQVEAALRLLFPQLPSNGVSGGDAWADSATYQVRLDAFDTRESASRRSTARIAPGSGGISIDAEEQVRREGGAVQGGRPMALAGGGLRRVSYSFAGAGWVSALRASDSLELRVTMTEGSLNIPVRWRTTVVARLRDTLPR